MYGAMAMGASPRADAQLQLRVTTAMGDGDGQSEQAALLPLGLRPDSPVGVETDSALAHKRAVNAFIPVVCSIFGIIIFMRLSSIVGQAGLLRTWAIIFVAFAITVLSLGSLSALASARSGRREESGLYESVLLAVGENAGPVLGALLFLAFSIASAYYLLGFTEITLFYLRVSTEKRHLPWNEDGAWPTVVVASLTHGILTLSFGLGAHIDKYTLRAVFVVVLISIGSSVFLLVVTNSSTDTGMSRTILHGNITEHSHEHLLKMFGEFFPAFCGVMAGTHLADTLKSPTESARPTRSVGPANLIVGVHKALGFTCIVYLLLSLVYASCVENGVLRKRRFIVQHVVDSILGIPIVYLGIAATTLTSAVSNLTSAASLYETTQLQLFRSLPRRRTHTSATVQGLVLAWCLTQVAILCGSVDTIIPLVSSTFLFAFAVLNFVCFYHEISSRSFRPTFMLYSKWSALLGFCASVGALFVVMSFAFVSFMLVGMLVALGYFQKVLPDLIGNDQRQNSMSDTNQQDPYVLEDILDGSSRRQRTTTHEEDERKRIELAAMYVRDALNGRFLGEEYVYEGIHRLEYKRWYHSLQSARVGNMVILLCLSFFEVPSWCYFASTCGSTDSTLMWSLPVFSREATLAIELLNLGVLGLEAALKYQYLGKRFYFVNKWHIVQLVLLLVDTTSVLLIALVPRDDPAAPSFARETSFRPVVVSPMIRPLLLLAMSERLRSGFVSLLRVLPRVFDGLLTLLVLIIIYATCGMVLFEGTDEGRQYFPDFETACMNMLILLTTANFPDIMMPAYYETRYSSLFFVTFLMIGLLLVMNLVFASMYQNYRQEVSQRAIKFAQRRQRSLEFAFRLLPGDICTDEHQEEMKIITRGTFENLIAELLRPIVSLFEWTSSEARVQAKEPYSPGARRDEINLAQFISKIKSFADRQKHKPRKKGIGERRRSSSLILETMADCVRTKWFDYGVDVAILGNLLAIVFEIQAKIDMKDDVYMRWERFMPVFSVVYLLEMVLKMYAHRCRGYISVWKNRYDCIVTVVIFVAEASIQVHYTSDMDWQWIRVLLLLRFLRCLRLLVALQSISTMFSIVLRLIPAFSTLYGMLGIVMMEYAVIGVHFFGGRIVLGDPRLANTIFGKSNYYPNNFNDFPSAMTTLFELLLVNNWNVIMEGAEAVTSKWSRVYFISFYVIAVVMMLNLVVAFVVEAYFEQVSTSDQASLQPRDSLASESSSGVLTVVTPSDEHRDSVGQHLLRKRQLGLRPRGDSVYIEEFL